jgi:hypothetical protein
MKKLLTGLAILAASHAFADQVEGLRGTYYNPPADTTVLWGDFSFTQAYLASNPTPSGTFTASNINYAGYDGTSIVNFLGSDGASFAGTDGNLSDGVLVIQGWITLASGSTTFTVTHDDGFALFLDGTSLAQSGCCGTDSVTVDVTRAGPHAIEIEYNNAYFPYWNGGSAALALSINGQQVDPAVLSPVPEPQNLALLLAGLGLAGVTMRRRLGK